MTILGATLGHSNAGSPACSPPLNARMAVTLPQPGLAPVKHSEFLTTAHDGLRSNREGQKRTANAPTLRGAGEDRISSSRMTRSP